VAEVVFSVAAKNESEQSHFAVAIMEAVNPGEFQIKNCYTGVQMQPEDVLQTLVVVLVVSSSLNHLWVVDEFPLQCSSQDYPGIFHSMRRFHLSYLQLDTQ